MKQHDNKAMGKNISLSITIPAFNEEETIQNVYSNIIDAVKKITDNYEIVFVNDGSTDRTGSIMDILQKKNQKHIVVVHHKKNKGFSGAMKTCYVTATKDFIFLGPADGQFDFRQTEKFIIEMVKKKRDIVVAYRNVNDEAGIRKLNSFIFHFIARTLFSIRLKEFSSCILYTKKVRDSIRIDAAPFSCLFLPELLHKATKKKYSFGQVAITFGKRQGGKAKGSNPRMIVKTIQEMIRFWMDIQLGKVTY